MLKKLFDSLVSPIIEYGAAIWGYKSYSYINAIQSRACRFFLGVGRYTPNAAVMGDMGWIPIYHKQWKIISSQWCKLMNMDQNRMNRKMFAWADDVSLKSKRVKNWNYVDRKQFRDRPFNLQGGVMVFCFVQNFFFGQRELEYLFILSREARNLFSEFNIRLYDKKSESNYFFFLHQYQNIFFNNVGNQNIFLEK